jgi:hypothetical protein
MATSMPSKILLSMKNKGLSKIFMSMTARSVKLARDLKGIRREQKE